jgi:hypothetical protein
MADAHWRTGNTRPSVLITLNMGIDPETGTPRTLSPSDTVTQIIRNTTTPGAAITRALTIVSAAENKVRYTPSAGDLAVAGSYRVMFDITDTGGKVESVPDEEGLDYEYLVGARRDA